MTEYKGIDNDESITYYFGDLLINIYNNYISKQIIELFFSESKYFHT